VGWVRARLVVLQLPVGRARLNRAKLPVLGVALSETRVALRRTARGRTATVRAVAAAGWWKPLVRSVEEFGGGPAGIIGVWGWRGRCGRGTDQSRRD